MNILLLSNSTNFEGSYLEHCASAVDRTLGDARELLLIPYAAVTYSYEEYEKYASEALAPFGIKVRSIHRFDDPIGAVTNAKAIAVAGGNTFRLLQLLYENKLVDLIKKRVEDGVPYVGWSAGSNVAGPTICTTNDMPIVMPPTFNAIGLVDYQLNPHYTDRAIPEHNGESRNQRLLEYIELNRDQKVVALPEGSWIEINDQGVQYFGEERMKVYQYGKNPKFLNDTESENFLNQ